MYSHVGVLGWLSRDDHGARSRSVHPRINYRSAGFTILYMSHWELWLRL